MVDNVDTNALRNAFPILNDSVDAQYRYYKRSKKNQELLKKLGHYLFMSPINLINSIIEMLDKMHMMSHKESVLITAIFVREVPPYNGHHKQKSIEEWCNHFKQSESQFVNAKEDLKDELEEMMSLSTDEIVNIHWHTRDTLYMYLNNLKYSLAPIIVSNYTNKVQEHVVPSKSHPVYKLYEKEDLMGGAVIGNILDTKYSTSLISSNDISGLLVKLKTVYMRAAYLQLIQTLSQLAEKKSYQTITFRQDELKGVLDQIRLLSNETFRQLKMEDELISKICYNIIKTVDPNINKEKVLEALSIDIGNYPANAYALTNYSLT